MILILSSPEVELLYLSLTPLSLLQEVLSEDLPIYFPHLHKILRVYVLLYGKSDPRAEFHVGIEDPVEIFGVEL